MFGQYKFGKNKLHGDFESIEEGTELISKYLKSKKENLKLKITEQTLSRHILLRLGPEYVKLVDIADLKPVGANARVEQLRDDIQQKFIQFNNILPPTEITSLTLDEFKTGMEEFLLNRATVKCCVRDVIH